MIAASPWRLRDSIAATALFLATAAFTLWQNSRVAVLWDLSFLLDSAYRFSLSQIPYKNIPFAHAPVTFLLHAGIIHLFGRVYLPHIVCAALEAGAATLLVWRMLLGLLQPFGSRAWELASVLAAPLVVLGVYSIYPHPIYDSDCILAVLLALFLLLNADEHRGRNALAGAMCVLPLYFKLNIGLAFLAATLAAVVLMALCRRLQRASIGLQLFFFAGAAAMLAASLLLLHMLVGLHNYFYWTVTFASQRRLPGLPVVLASYRQTSLLWSLPTALAAIVLLRSNWRKADRWRRPIAFLLLAAPFLWTAMLFTVNSDPDDRADQLLSLWPHLLILSAALAIANLRPHLLKSQVTPRTLLPLILLATIHGTFLSQQLWGSTYAIWPLLMLLIAMLLPCVPEVARPLALTVATVFLVCGGIYSVSHERLEYIHLDGSEAHANLPALRGLTTPGPWIPAFEQLVQFTNQKIPAGDGILLLPGEDLFYFATGRLPQFPVLLFDPATDPYTPQQTLDQVRARNIRWLIVKRNLQLTAIPYDELPEILRVVQQDFVPYRTLDSYDIYRRR